MKAARHGFAVASSASRRPVERVHCRTQAVHDLVSEHKPLAREVLPASREMRRPMNHLIDIDRMGTSPARRTVEASYGDRSLRWPPVLHVTLEDTYVFGSGTVVWENTIIGGTLLPGASPARIKAQFPQGELQADGSWLVDTSRVVHHDRGFLASRFRVGTYGHWLGELLPRIDVAHQHALLADRDLFFPANCNPVRRGTYTTMLRDSLSAVGVSPSCTTQIPRGGLRVARLELLTPLGRWGSLRSDVQRTFDRIARRNRSGGCRERLYLTREGVGDRRLANEGEVRRLVEKHKFTVVHTEGASFRAQVEMFSTAEMICGPLGSAFTNLVFAPPDCRLVALIPEFWADVFYYDLAAIRGSRGSKSEARSSTLSTSATSATISRWTSTAWHPPWS